MGCRVEVMDESVFFVVLELTGVNSTEWNSLFNGQLDDVSSLDPMTGVQNPIQPDHGMVSPSSHSTCMNIGCQPPQIDR